MKIKKEEIKNNEENKEIKTQVENILGAFTKESENIPPKLMIEEVKEKTEKRERIPSINKSLDKKQKKIKKTRKAKTKIRKTSNTNEIIHDEGSNSVVKNIKNELKESISHLMTEKFLSFKKKKLSKDIIEYTNIILDKSLKSINIAEKPLFQMDCISTIHKDITCEGCKLNPIIGIRYKCSECKNFNYCEACEEINNKNHVHPFIKMRNLEEKHQIENEFLIRNTSSLNIINAENKNNNNNLKFPHLSSKCISNNVFEIEQGTNEFVYQINLHNDGNINWPSPSTLKNTMGIFSEKILISYLIKPGDTCQLNVTIPTKGLKVGEYHSRWQLFDTKDNAFGSNIDIKFNVILKKGNNKDNIREIEIKGKDSKKIYRFYNKLTEMKTAYGLIDIPNERILEALEKSNGDLEEAIVYLL